MRILVADDSHDAVLMLLMLLREEGHEAEGVYSGIDVVPAAQRLKPDAVILDIEMPRMSGYAVAQELRSMFGEELLLIAVTGKWTMPSDRKLATEVGFDHHLVKPVPPQALLAVLCPASRQADLQADPQPTRAR